MEDNFGNFAKNILKIKSKTIVSIISNKKNCALYAQFFYSSKIHKYKSNLSLIYFANKFCITDKLYFI